MDFASGLTIMINGIVPEVKREALIPLTMTTVFSTSLKPKKWKIEHKDCEWSVWIEQQTGFLYWWTSILSTGRLKPIFKPFDSRCNYIRSKFIKLISLLVIWSWKYNNTLRNKIIILQTSVIQVCGTTLNIYFQWIYKTHIQKHKNHSKVSCGARRFSQNLCASRIHNTTYRIVNLEDTIDVIFSGVIIHDTNPFQPTFHIMVWQLKEGRAVILKLLLLIDDIGCFVLLIFVKMLLFLDLQNWSRPFYLLTNLI